MPGIIALLEVKSLRQILELQFLSVLQSEALAQQATSARQVLRLLNLVKKENSNQMKDKVLVLSAKLVTIVMSKE